jgi:hypothetical protein
MNTRTQITLDPETQRRAQAKASELGISFAEYIRRLLADDLEQLKPKADVSLTFDIVDEGPSTNVARDKHKMIAEAIWQEQRRETGSKHRVRGRVKVNRR